MGPKSKKSKNSNPDSKTNETACFMCLKECKSSQLFSFQTISRYLKINFDKNLKKGSSNYALLCGECNEEHEIFTKLYGELEIIKMKINLSLGRIHEKMVQAKGDENRLKKYREIISLGGNCNIQYVEGLRDEIVANCNLEVENAPPRVRLRKWDNEKKDKVKVAQSSSGESLLPLPLETTETESAKNEKKIDCVCVCGGGIANKVKDVKDTSCQTSEDSFPLLEIQPSKSEEKNETDLDNGDVSSNFGGSQESGFQEGSSQELNSNCPVTNANVTDPESAEVDMVLQSNLSPSSLSLSGPFFFEEDLEGVDIEDEESFIFQVMGLPFSKLNDSIGIGLCNTTTTATPTGDGGEEVTKDEAGGQSKIMCSKDMERPRTENENSSCEDDDDDDDDDDDPLAAYAKALEKMERKEKAKHEESDGSAKVSPTGTDPYLIEDRQDLEITEAVNVEPAKESGASSVVESRPESVTSSPAKSKDVSTAAVFEGKASETSVISSLSKAGKDTASAAVPQGSEGFLTPPPPSSPALKTRIKVVTSSPVKSRDTSTTRALKLAVEQFIGNLIAQIIGDIAQANIDSATGTATATAVSAPSTTSTVPEKDVNVDASSVAVAVPPSTNSTCISDPDQPKTLGSILPNSVLNNIASNMDNKDSASAPKINEPEPTSLTVTSPAESVPLINTATATTKPGNTEFICPIIKIGPVQPQLFTPLLLEGEVRKDPEAQLIITGVSGANIPPPRPPPLTPAPAAAKVSSKITQNRVNTTRHKRAEAFGCMHCGVEYKTLALVDEHVLASHCDKIFASGKDPSLTDAEFRVAVDRFFSYETYSKSKCNYCRLRCGKQTYFDNFQLRKHYIKEHFEQVSFHLGVFQQKHLSEFKMHPQGSARTVNLTGANTTTTTYSWINAQKIKCSKCGMEFPKGQLQLHQQAFGCSPNSTVQALALNSASRIVFSQGGAYQIPLQTTTADSNNVVQPTTMIVSGGGGGGQSFFIQSGSGAGSGSSTITSSASGLPLKRKVFILRTGMGSGASQQQQLLSQLQPLKKIKLAGVGGQDPLAMGSSSVGAIGTQPNQNIQFVMIDPSMGQGQMPLANLTRGGNGNVQTTRSSSREEADHCPTITSTYSMASAPLPNPEEESRSSSSGGDPLA